MKEEWKAALGQWRSMTYFSLEQIKMKSLKSPYWK